MLSLIHKYPILNRYITSNKFWCPYFYSSITISSLGYYSACCRATPFFHNIKNTSISEYINCYELTTIREEMIYFDKQMKLTNIHCKKCRDYEDLNVPSMRTLLISKITHLLSTNQDSAYLYFLEINIKKSLQGIPFDISEMFFDLIDLQIFGNLCNLKCIMCHPASSSAFDNNVINPYKDLGSKRKQQFDCELELILEKTSRLKLIGGEPTINKTCIDFLDWLSYQKKFQQLYISITTNGTIISDRFVRSLRRFKNFRLGISIDAYGDINDLQRRGSSFKTIDKNIDYYKSQLPIVNLEIISATTNLTCSNLPTLYKYIQSKNLHPAISCVVLRPEIFSIVHLPDDIRKYYLYILQNSTNNKIFNSHIFALTNGKYNQNIFVKFIQHLKHILEYSDILKYFPEYVTYLDYGDN